MGQAAKPFDRAPVGPYDHHPHAVGAGRRRGVKLTGTIAIQLGLDLVARGRDPLELGSLRLDQPGQLIRRGGVLRRETRQQRLVGPGPPDSARAAQELEPRRLSHPFQLAEQDGPDLAGRADVGAAARAPVQTLDAHDAQRPRPVRPLPKGGGCGGLLEAQRHRPVLRHHRIGAGLGGHDLLGREGGDVEVQRGGVLSEMHAHGAGAVEVLQHRREKVLPGVLLHVIEAPRPVHFAAHPAIAQRGGQEVRDPLALVHHVQDLGAAQPPRVVRLAAGRGIERGAIEVYTAAGVGMVEHRRIEGREVGVVVVESLSHAECL